VSEEDPVDEIVELMVFVPVEDIVELIVWD